MANQPPNQPQGSSQQTQGQGQQQPPQQRRQQQPPQGPPGGRGGGGRRPSRGSNGGGLFRNIALLAAALAVVGIAFGLMPTVYGSLADDPVETGTEEELNQDEEQLSDDQQEQQDKQRKNQIIGIISSIGPYFAILLAAIVGAVAGLKLGDSTQEALITAGAGAFAGVFLFVFLSTAIAVFQYAPIEPSFGNSTAERIAETQYGALLVNSLALGVVGAIAGAGMGGLTNQLES